jgi:hypothetical protein
MVCPPFFRGLLFFFCLSLAVTSVFALYVSVPTNPVTQPRYIAPDNPTLDTNRFLPTTTIQPDLNRYTAPEDSVVASAVSWLQLNNFPSACPAGQAIVKLGLFPLCAPFGSAVALDWNLFTNFPSACPLGYAVQGVGSSLSCVLLPTGSGVVLPLGDANILDLNYSKLFGVPNYYLQNDANSVFEKKTDFNSDLNGGLVTQTCPNGQALNSLGAVPVCTPSSGAQTPWVSNINGAGFKLTGVGDINNGFNRVYTGGITTFLPDGLTSYPNPIIDPTDWRRVEVDYSQLSFENILAHHGIQLRPVSFDVNGFNQLNVSDQYGEPVLLNVLGNISADSNISATYFKGNGSLLTGISTGVTDTNWQTSFPTFDANMKGQYRKYSVDLNTSANINADGNISATYFEGNGSLLTGINADANNVFEKKTDFNADLNNSIRNTYGKFTVDLNTSQNINADKNISGQCLKLSGDSVPWCVKPSGGSGTPGGSNTQIQFNDGGSFGGAVGINWNKSTFEALIDGNVTIPNIPNYGDIATATGGGDGSYSDSDTYGFGVDVYAYKTVNGTNIYSKNPINFSWIGDGGGYYGNVAITYSWLPVVGADGYKLVVDASDGWANKCSFSGYDYSHTTTDTSWTTGSCSDWTAGAVITPSSSSVGALTIYAPVTSWGDLNNYGTTNLNILNVGGTFNVASVTTNSLTANGSSTFNNGLTVNGAVLRPNAGINMGSNSILGVSSVQTNQIRGNSVPTIHAGTGAGTSPTISINGTDIGGQITVTTGTSPTASGMIFDVRYGSANLFASYPVFSPANANAAALTGTSGIYIDSNKTDFNITAGSSALTGATTYKWNYVVIGR